MGDLVKAAVPIGLAIMTDGASLGESAGMSELALSGGEMMLPEVGGYVGADTAAGLTGGLAAGAESSWLSSAMPEIGGDLSSLTGAGFSSALPQASMLPEAMSSVPGAMAPEGFSSPLNMVDSSMTVPGSFWENISTPIEQAYNIGSAGLDTFNQMPIGKALNTANTGLGALNQYQNYQNSKELMDRQLAAYNETGSQSVPQTPQGSVTPNSSFGYRNYRMN